jgi:hypothetical protein
MENRAYWTKKNKKILEEMENISRWYYEKYWFVCSKNKFIK